MQICLPPFPLRVLFALLTPVSMTTLNCWYPFLLHFPSTAAVNNNPFRAQSSINQLSSRMAAEVHIIGQIESAYGFPDNRLACRWNLHLGGGWRVVEGEQEGQTQTDLPDTDRAYFAHPIDVHLATRTIQGWPKILLEVWHYDQYGRHEIYGYGSCFVPTSPGEHQVLCHCWRPKGDFREELSRHFVGGGLQLRSLAVLAEPSQSAQLRTVAAGTVELRLAIVSRHFDRFGILC